MLQKTGRKKKDVFDRIAADIERLRAAAGEDAIEITITLDEGLQKQLALRTGQAARAFGCEITPEQTARAALLRGLRMRRI